jgi:light-regulated signal transduction histidine kinase (bacteriophytochrome)
MARLIDDILDLSRITRRELLLELNDVTQMARDIAAQIDELEPERNVEWRIEEGLEILADPTLLRRAIENLLRNAHKYSRDSDRAIIEFGSQQKGAETIYYVRDNGVGFDMQYADKLFTPFQRLHGDEFEGSGIGLATVDRIMRRHKGHIWADSCCGQGTTVFFSFG